MDYWKGGLAVAIICFSVFYFGAAKVIENTLFFEQTYNPVEARSVNLKLRGEPLTAGPQFTVSDEVLVTAPSLMKTSDSGRVTVEIVNVLIGHFDDFGTTPNADADRVMTTEPPSPPIYLKNYEDEYSISISASGMEFAPDEYEQTKSFEIPETGIPTGEPLVWHWLLSSEDPGNRLVIISGLPEETSRRSWSESTEARWLNPGVLEVKVKVLTPSGLTAEQQDWLNTLTAIVALAGAVAGFGLWQVLAKKVGQRKLIEEDTKPKLILPGDPRYRDFDDGS